MLWRFIYEKNGYFYASTEENLMVIPEGSQVYDNLTKCILRKSCELMSDKEIKPTIGVLTDAESEDKEYTIIERYDNQFSSLNRSIFIYYIPINYNKVINNEITSETKMLKKQKIDNLYEYLETKKNITLIKNDDLDKCWYDIPSDNGDIIQKYFLSIADEENKDLKKNKIINLKKLFPKELMLINKLEKLMLKMEKDNFISFINIIYDKRERMIDYDTIRKTGAKFTKMKSKKVAYINR